MRTKVVVGCLWACLLTPVIGSAGVIYNNTGNFSFDSDVVQIPFSIGISAPVTMFTTSFANGSVGFEPVLTLFDGSGNLLLQDATGGTVPSCGARAIDVVSGYCLDAYIQATLNAGSYTLALSEYDNIPSGPTLADGFPQSAGTNFTGPEFLGGAGSFILFDATQRTSAWALQIDGPVSGVPEPDTAGLIAGAAAAMLAARWRRRASS